MTDKKTVEEKKGTVASTEKLFFKEQLKTSKKYSNKKDLLEVLLDDDKKYSISAVDGIIEKFMKGKVK